MACPQSASAAGELIETPRQCGAVLSRSARDTEQGPARLSLEIIMKRNHSRRPTWFAPAVVAGALAAGAAITALIATAME